MSNWEKVFYNQISAYIEKINQFLSTHYEVTRLGNYIKIVGGYAFKSSNYRNIGIPIIRISDFQNEKIVLDNVKYYEENQNLSKYKLFEGDIIIAMTGGTIGKLAIVQENLGKLYLNQRVGKFEVINHEKFVQEYVYWIARGVEERIKKLAWGGAQPNVSNKQIENMDFILPSKEIQSKIISFLNDLKNNKLKQNYYFDEKCEKYIINLQYNGINLNNIQIETSAQQSLLKQLKQTILQEAIEGKLTAKWRAKNPDIGKAKELLEQIKKEKEKLIKDKKIKASKPLPPINEDEIPFDIPQNWEWCRTDDICFSISSGSTPSKDAFIGDDGISYLKVYNIQNQKIDFHFKPQFIKQKINNTKLKRSILYPQDVVMNIVGPPLGKIAIIPNIYPQWNCNQAIVHFKLIEPLMHKYLYYFLRELSFLKYIHFKGVAGQDNISITQSRNILFPLPPIEEQKEIVSTIEKLFTLCNELESEINQNKVTVDNLMATVLKEAFETKENIHEYKA